MYSREKPSLELRSVGLLLFCVMCMRTPETLCMSVWWKTLEAIYTATLWDYMNRGKTVVSVAGLKSAIAEAGYRWGKSCLCCGPVDSNWCLVSNLYMFIRKPNLNIPAQPLLGQLNVWNQSYRRPKALEILKDRTANGCGWWRLILQLALKMTFQLATTFTKAEEVDLQTRPR